MSEATQTTEQSQQPAAPVVKEDLFLKMRRIRKNNRRLKMNQTRIAKELKRTQSGISRAMLEPDTYPGLAQEIEKFLDRFEVSQMQSTQSKAASA